jgi:Arc/MetJ family transcription regulator
MRTTITIDDELLARAHELTGTAERSTLIRQALEALVARESARRLARLGGTDPEAEATPRSRQTRTAHAARRLEGPPARASQSS